MRCNNYTTSLSVPRIGISIVVSFSKVTFRDSRVPSLRTLTSTSSSGLLVFRNPFKSENFDFKLDTTKYINSGFIIFNKDPHPPRVRQRG